MKKLILTSLILLALVLSGCNYPAYQETAPEQDDEAMATEIAKILTGTPVDVASSPTPRVVVEETTEEPEGEVAETDTPEPTSSPTVAPTATLADTDPALALGTPDWVDTMDDGDNWPTGVNKYTTIKFDSGYLKLTAETELDGWRLSWPFLGDFYLEASMQSPNCEGSDHFGLMFRVPAKADANKGYLFGITCDGRYSLRRWDGQTMFFPVNWTASDAINTGEDAVNKVGILAKGANLALYINGIKVKEVSDNAYLEGSFGIFVGSATTDDFTVWVDQVRYWVNP